MPVPRGRGLPGYWSQHAGQYYASLNIARGAARLARILRVGSESWGDLPSLISRHERRELVIWTEMRGLFDSVAAVSRGGLVSVHHICRV